MPPNYKIITTWGGSEHVREYSEFPFALQAFSNAMQNVFQDHNDLEAVILMRDDKIIAVANENEVIT